LSVEPIALRTGSIVYPEVFVCAGRSTKAVIQGIDTGARRTVPEPLEKEVQFFLRTFGPDLNIAFGGVADPAVKTPKPGLVKAGIAEAYTLNTALDTGKKGGRTGDTHKRPSS
jgi:hypothetical protein